ncbi:uncharacterized protein [Henckelia pumila]|uniref:uncharacterized protein n=1 Tax=Henckelia pumila TaxID=405737 RepID=UPI003C6DF1A5
MAAAQRRLLNLIVLSLAIAFSLLLATSSAKVFFEKSFHGIRNFIYKLQNIKETEAAKKLLQEKRRAGHAKVESSIPSSFSAEFSKRGKDYAEKFRKDNPKLYKNKSKMTRVWNPNTLFQLQMLWLED